MATSLDGLLELLGCPACGCAPCRLEPFGDLRCTVCGRTVPVRGGIPRFTEGSTDAGFDHRWQRRPRTQFDCTEETASTFAAKTGWTAADLAGRTVLDAGCGAGRYLARAAYLGARVVGTDGSAAALDAAAANVPGVELVQCDLLRLPLRDACVDAAFSLGVLHHTGDAAAAFREVARCVKPGGTMAVWVYAVSAREPWCLPLMDFLHEVTRALPSEVLYDICARRAPALRDHLRTRPWGLLHATFQISDHDDAERCIDDTFDWHGCYHRSHHTEEEVRGWFEAAGFAVTREGAFPVSMTGRKAA